MGVFSIKKVFYDFVNRVLLEAFNQGFCLRTRSVFPSFFARVFWCVFNAGCLWDRVILVSLGVSMIFLEKTC